MSPFWQTLLYMLIQDAGTGATLPPPDFTPPAWSALAAQWGSIPLPPVPTVVLGPTGLCIGHDDNESEDFELPHEESHEYGWDNESPRRMVHVKQFRIDWRPITNAAFYTFWKSRPDEIAVPKSWVIVDGEVHVRTLYGLVSLDIAATWPVLAAYDDLEKYARYKGGRIPTEHELRLFFDTYETGHAGGSNTGFRNWHPIP
jgi:L-histidine Nalpha-methyltransferase / hercynylcysteine S-oxide synthase